MTNICPTPPADRQPNKYDEMLDLSEQITKVITLRGHMMMIQSNTPQYGEPDQEAEDRFYNDTAEALTRLRKRLLALTKPPSSGTYTCANHPELETDSPQIVKEHLSYYPHESHLIKHESD